MTLFCYDCGEPVVSDAHEYILCSCCMGIRQPDGRPVVITDPAKIRALFEADQAAEP